MFVVWLVRTAKEVQECNTRKNVEYCEGWK